VWRYEDAGIAQKTYQKNQDKKPALFYESENTSQSIKIILLHKRI